VKAAVQRRYGSVDRVVVREVRTPTPGSGEVLVRVRAAAVTVSDTMARRGRPLLVRPFAGLLRPRRLVGGTEFSGDVEAIGMDVSRFSIGDRVFGSTGNRGGCYAEFVCISQDGFIAKMPANLSYRHGAPICGGLAAWNFLCDKAGLQRGHRILINSAWTDFGTVAVQLAKHLGAQVTVVCRCDDVEAFRSLGADITIGPAEDFTCGGHCYDVIFDTLGESSFSRCKRVLASDGIYLTTYPRPAVLLEMLWTSRIGHKKAVFSATGLLPISARLSFLEAIKRLIESGELTTVVDSFYPLERISEAYDHAERGQTLGTVVVMMNPRDDAE
jgi:NADPH:quinone reductase-like Zn-dependent oxidoreductase